MYCVEANYLRRASRCISMYYSLSNHLYDFLFLTSATNYQVYSVISSNFSNEIAFFHNTFLSKSISCKLYFIRA